jgi:N utilization substance protein B
VDALFWGVRDDVDAETKGFAGDLHRIAAARADEISALIERHAQHWRIERMPVVDRNLLRAATAEMLGFPKTPVAVIINETLELAKLYAAPESLNFLNGVLDAIGHDLLEQRLADRK